MNPGPSSSPKENMIPSDCHIYNEWKHAFNKKAQPKSRIIVTVTKEVENGKQEKNYFLYDLGPDSTYRCIGCLARKNIENTAQFIDGQFCARKFHDCARLSLNKIEAEQKVLEAKFKQSQNSTPKRSSRMPFQVAASASKNVSSPISPPPEVHTLSDSPLKSMLNSIERFLSKTSSPSSSKASSTRSNSKPTTDEEKKKEEEEKNRRTQITHIDFDISFVTISASSSNPQQPSCAAEKGKTSTKKPDKEPKNVPHTVTHIDSDISFVIIDPAAKSNNPGTSAVPQQTSSVAEESEASATKKTNKEPKNVPHTVTHIDSDITFVTIDPAAKSNNGNPENAQPSSVAEKGETSTSKKPGKVTPETSKQNKRPIPSKSTVEKKNQVARKQNTTKKAVVDEPPRVIISSSESEEEEVIKKSSKRISSSSKVARKQVMTHDESKNDKEMVPPRIIISTLESEYEDEVTISPSSEKSKKQKNTAMASDESNNDEPPKVIISSSESELEEEEVIKKSSKRISSSSKVARKQISESELEEVIKNSRKRSLPENSKSDGQEKPIKKVKFNVDPQIQEYPTSDFQLSLSSTSSEPEAIGNVKDAEETDVINSNIEIKPSNCSTSVKFVLPRSFFLQICCNKVHIEYSRSRMTEYWKLFDLKMVTPTSIPTGWHINERTSGYAAISIFFTSAEDELNIFKIEKSFCKYFFENLEIIGACFGENLAQKSAAEIGEIWCSDSFTKYHWNGFSLWFKCRIGVFEETEKWSRYGNWDHQEEDIPIFLVKKIGKKFCPIYCL